MSIGEQIIEEIGKQAMVNVAWPDKEQSHLFIWNENAADQLSALVESHIKTRNEKHS